MKSEIVYAVSRKDGTFLSDRLFHRSWTPFKHQARSWPDIELARAAVAIHSGEVTAFLITEITPDGDLLH